ncbi:hypothetical protein HDIA_4165 [Hartmannibacter diazotrophicus]|uniref:DUF3251 domain-containing protein n=1 Tax=Hartmannibacter diazotrophicus TaxID=1482074 RepID=A0A2C9DBR7_9HYPH|nr:hypothetical protein [Hartmannibacter diazotrophicus]SON57706.1 hypothetical protein HDIA_4165 [Hartmannibacter diazotrophicus]
MQQMRLVISVAALMLSGTLALAEPPQPDFKALLTPSVMKDIKGWVETDIVRVSVAAQNDRLQKLEQAKIDELDQQWRKEREMDDKPLIAATLSNPLSIYLTRMQGRSIGLYAEIFVMDQNGLNVGQSSITSDFWQGDEAKFQKTYDVSKDAVFVDDPEWDDDSKIWRGQVSFTLTDSSGQNEIGAVTVELNLTELQRREAFGT